MNAGECAHSLPHCQKAGWWCISCRLKKSWMEWKHSKFSLQTLVFKQEHDSLKWKVISWIFAKVSNTRNASKVVSFEIAANYSPLPFLINWKETFIEKVVFSFKWSVKYYGFCLSQGTPLWTQNLRRENGKGLGVSHSYGIWSYLPPFSGRVGNCW